MKFAVLLSYDGTRFCGWQEQRGRSDRGVASIQSSMQDALLKMTGEKTTVTASGRTDAGVHALGQVAHFDLKQREWQNDVIRKGLNALLPADIRVRDVASVSEDFHSQRQAQRKQYSYYFLCSLAPLPHLKPYSLWVRRPLDLEAMRRAAEALPGTHDFAAFQASGSSVKTTVRTIFEADLNYRAISFPPVETGSAQLLRFRVMGSGFLKQMVRSLAGTLLEIGEGRRPVESLAELLKKPDRASVGVTASPAGLWLEWVAYPSRIFDNSGPDL